MSLFGYDFGKEIKRKITCKKCGKDIFVRQGKSVTEREKEILDWQKYMEFLVPDIDQIRSIVENKLKKKFGKEPAAHDVVWGMFNYIVLKLRKPSDLSIIYDNMATFLESEGKRKQADKLRQVSLKMTITDWKTSSMPYKIRIKNSEDDFVCVECKKISDNVYDGPNKLDTTLRLS